MPFQSNAWGSAPVGWIARNSRAASYQTVPNTGTARTFWTNNTAGFKRTVHRKQQQGPVVVVAGAAGITAPIGLALETDLAQSFGRSKTRALAQALETDLAQAFGRSKARALALALETDLAQAFARAKSRGLGQVSETDLAQAIGRRKARALGFASETDLAQTIIRSGAILRAIGLALETDFAFAITRLSTAPVGQSDSYPLHQQPLGGGRWQDKPLEVRIREGWDDDEDALIALLLSL